MALQLVEAAELARQKIPQNVNMDLLSAFERGVQEDNMAEVIGVRFKEVGKVYYFDPLDNKLSAGDMVIVETARGLECGKVATPKGKPFPDEELAYPLKPLIRIATENDLRHLEKNKLKRRRHTEFASRKLQTTNLK